MKKIKYIIAIVIMSIVFISCNKYEERVNKKSNDVFTDVVEFEYKNHEYIMFKNGMTYTDSGIVHNPDCKCFKNK